MGLLVMCVLVGLDTAHMFVGPSRDLGIPAGKLPGKSPVGNAGNYFTRNPLLLRTDVRGHGALRRAETLQPSVR